MNRRKFIVTTGIAGILQACYAPIIIPHRRKHHSAAAPYILEENCEGTGTPTDWTNQGTVDWDEAAVSPPEGSQCVETNFNAAAAYTFYTFPAGAQSSLTIFFAYRRSQNPSTTFRIIGQLQDGGSSRCVLSMNNTIVRIAHGSASADASFGAVNNTWYYFWYDYAQGSGANGEASVTVSTTQVRADGQTASVTTGTSTTTVSIALFGYPSGNVAGNQFFYDKLRGRAGRGSIGDSPA